MERGKHLSFDTHAVSNFWELQDSGRSELCRSHFFAEPLTLKLFILSPCGEARSLKSLSCPGGKWTQKSHCLSLSWLLGFCSFWWWCLVPASLPYWPLVPSIGIPVGCPAAQSCWTAVLQWGCMRHQCQTLPGAGLGWFLLNIQAGNLLNPGFGSAESIQDVVAVASNTTYTGHCPESGRQKKLSELGFKQFHMFKHPDLEHSADWSMSRSAVSLWPNFHNHGNAVGQSGSPLALWPSHCETLWHKE